MRGLPEFSEGIEMRRLRLESVVLLAAIAVSGVAYSQTTTPQQGTPSTQPPVSLSPGMPVANPPKMSETAGTKPVSTVDAETFVLGPEDQITISMWDEPKFDGVYTIRPDGKIIVKLIGEIQAAGLTPLQLQQVVDKAASNLLRTPRSTVNVTGVHSKHVYFDGEGIAQPGAIDLVIPIHLLDGLSARGGFKDFADKNHIKIMRDGKVFMTVKYKELVSGKHPELNIRLQDQDHVIVN
jgi:polysaccharide export outer membrane protein